MTRLTRPHLSSPETGQGAPAQPRAPRRRSVRVGGVATLVLTASLSLSGCQWTSPITTEKQYDAADGVRTTVGALDLRDMLVVGSTKGGPGTLSGYLHNGGQSDLQVSFATADKPAGRTVTVPAGGTTTVSTQSERITLPTVAEPPGAMVELSISSAAGNTVLDVPVLPATEYYATLAPTPSATASTATTTATGSPTGTNATASQTATAPAQTGAPTQTPQSTAASTSN